jgi:predicted DNA-binding transcriptional regulator AlpA
MPAPRRLLTYADLVEYGVVGNRTTLARLIARDGFPAGFKLGENGSAHRWLAKEVDEWVTQRSVTDNST